LRMPAPGIAATRLLLTLDLTFQKLRAVGATSKEAARRGGQPLSRPLERSHEVSLLTR
jgi:hypothetical protein